MLFSGRRSIRTLIVFLTFIILSISLGSAAPAVVRAEEAAERQVLLERRTSSGCGDLSECEKTISTRQAPINLPAGSAGPFTEIQRTNTCVSLPCINVPTAAAQRHTPSLSPAGVVTSTCLITLTPASAPAGTMCAVLARDSNTGLNLCFRVGFASASGSSIVFVDRACSVILDASGVLATLSTSVVSTVSISNATAAVSSASTTTAASSVVSTCVVSAPAVTASAQSAIIELVMTTGVATPAGSAPAQSAPVSTSLTASIPAPAATIGASSISASAVAENVSVSSIARAAESEAAQLVLPGTQLQVLPIGLGVFAGVAVIAISVVAFVTFERRKYRAQFRERKMRDI